MLIFERKTGKFGDEYVKKIFFSQILKSFTKSFCNCPFMLKFVEIFVILPSFRSDRERIGR
jgi:hypothetical protein